MRHPAFRVVMLVAGAVVGLVLALAVGGVIGFLGTVVAALLTPVAAVAALELSLVRVGESEGEATADEVLSQRRARILVMFGAVLVEAALGVAIAVAVNPEVAARAAQMPRSDDAAMGVALLGLVIAAAALPARKRVNELRRGRIARAASSAASEEPRNAFRGFLTAAQARILSDSIRRRRPGFVIRLSSVGFGAGVFFFVGGVALSLRPGAPLATSWLVGGAITAIVFAAQRWSENGQELEALRKIEVKGFVEPEGLRVMDANAEVLFLWSAVQHVDPAASLVVLWFAGGRYVPLTETMFPTPAEFQAIVSRVRPGADR